MSHTLKNEIKLMFSSGRLNRIRFIAYQGFASTCIGLVAVFLAIFIPNKNSCISEILGVVAVPCMALPLWWLSRRINDTGKSSKWIWKLIPIGLLLGFIPSIFKVTTAGLISTHMYGAEYAEATAKFIVAIMYVLSGLFIFGITGFMSFIMIFIPGNPGTNKFGPPSSKNNFFTSVFSVLFIIYGLLTGLSIAVPIALAQAGHSINDEPPPRSAVF